MAKNYTFAEACAIINEGTNTEAIADIGRRYPILLYKVSQVTAVAGDKFVDLMGYMPDYLTANKVNSALKATGSAESTEDETDAEATDSDETEATEEAGGMPDYDSMSAKQLWDILGKAGKRKTAKSTKKADLVAACKAMHEAGSTEAEDEDEAEAEAETEETSSNPYDGKSAMELFKMCKQRGIKAAPKKAAKYYTDLLIKADADVSEDESEDEEDWGDEEAAETKEEKKPAKKNGKATNEEKKTSKKATTEDDGDDDWDI